MTKRWTKTRARAADLAARCSHTRSVGVAGLNIDAMTTVAGAIAARGVAGAQQSCALCRVDGALG